MGYFDSAKNRAAWERKMAGLREERKRREQEGFKPGTPQDEKKAAAVLKPGVTRVTFAQLEAEEQAEREKARSAERPHERQREASREERRMERSEAAPQMKPRERSM